MWYERELLPYRGPPKKLKGLEREKALMKILDDLKRDWNKLNKIWGIGIYGHDNQSQATDTNESRGRPDSAYMCTKSAEIISECAQK